MVIESLIFANEPTSDSGIAYTLWIDTGAIVTYGDDDLIALIGGGEFNLASRWFALLDTNFRRFDGMVHSITHEVQQWSGNFFIDGAIYFCFFALQKELELFMLLESNGTSSAVETRSHG